MMIWAGGKEGSIRINVSRDTLERRGRPWTEEFRSGTVRYKHLELTPGDKIRRYYVPDIDALLKQPPGACPPRSGLAGGIQYNPAAS